MIRHLTERPLPPAPQPGPPSPLAGCLAVARAIGQARGTPQRGAVKPEARCHWQATVPVTGTQAGHRAVTAACRRCSGSGSRHRPGSASGPPTAELDRHGQ